MVAAAAAEAAVAAGDRTTWQWSLCACRSCVVVLAVAAAVYTIAMRSALDSITLVEVLAAIPRVRRTLTNAAAVYTVAMRSALDSITLVEVLAAIPRVRRTLTNATAVNAAATSPAVHLHGKLAVVDDSFAHASTVAFVALAQTVDARAVRSTPTTSPIG
eukprot:COSAG06_NODE_20943_length_775_cov_2.389053_1_plen_159_part_10